MSFSDDNIYKKIFYNGVEDLLSKNFANIGTKKNLDIEKRIQEIFGKDNDKEYFKKLGTLTNSTLLS